VRRTSSKLEKATERAGEGLAPLALPCCGRSRAPHFEPLTVPVPVPTHDTTHAIFHDILKPHHHHHHLHHHLHSTTPRYTSLPSRPAPSDRRASPHLSHDLWPPLNQNCWSMMTRKDGAVRNSSATSSSTDSWKSTDTIKPGSLFRGPSRRGAPMSVKTDGRNK